MIRVPIPALRCACVAPQRQVHVSVSLMERTLAVFREGGKGFVKPRIFLIFYVLRVALKENIGGSVMFRALVAIALGAFGLSAATASAEDWSYKITPYLWVPSVNTSLDVGPNPPVEGSKSILDVLDGAFLIAGEARRDEWSFLGEFNYLNLRDDFGIAPNDPIAGWQLRGTMISLAASRTIVDTPKLRFEGLAGLRRWDVKPSTTVLDTTLETTVSWTDPIVGARLGAPISDRLSFSGVANIGGFGVGTKRQWEVLAQAEWRATELISVAGGYRHLDIDFKDGGKVIDMQLSGPFLAVSFNF